MRSILLPVLFLFALQPVCFGQGGLVSKEKIDLRSSSYWREISHNDTLSESYGFLDSISFYEITYWSDSLKIRGFIVEPLTQRSSNGER